MVPSQGRTGAPRGDPPIRFAADLDRHRIVGLFRRVGRVHIAPILARDCAARILGTLCQETEWQLHLNDGDRPINLQGDGLERLTQAERARFLASVHASAACRFQYLFNSYPISDLYERGELHSTYLMRVYEFLNSTEFLEFAREVTGEHAIAYADAQATRYRPGHFLAQHDDSVDGKHRLAAYVLNFTPHWKPDWGGILQFIDRDGHIAEGYTPVFNALNLFRVPQAHAVSYVVPYAQGERLSIAGWLRAAAHEP